MSDRGVASCSAEGASISTKAVGNRSSTGTATAPRRSLPRQTATRWHVVPPFLAAGQGPAVPKFAGKENCSRKTSMVNASGHGTHQVLKQCGVLADGSARALAQQQIAFRRIKGHFCFTAADASCASRHKQSAPFLELSLFPQRFLLVEED